MHLATYRSRRPIRAPGTREGTAVQLMRLVEHNRAGGLGMAFSMRDFPAGLVVFGGARCVPIGRSVASLCWYAWLASGSVTLARCVCAVWAVCLCQLWRMLGRSFMLGSAHACVASCALEFTS